MMWLCGEAVMQLGGSITGMQELMISKAFTAKLAELLKNTKVSCTNHALSMEYLCFIHALVMH
jgi:hypothetical protein